MHEETSVQGVRGSRTVWYGDDFIAAEWQDATVPDELVHYLLGGLVDNTRGPVGWLDGRAPVSLYVSIAFSPEEVPF